MKALKELKSSFTTLWRKDSDFRFVIVFELSTVAFHVTYLLGCRLNNSLYTTGLNIVMLLLEQVKVWGDRNPFRRIYPLFFAGTHTALFTATITRYLLMYGG